MSKKKKKKKNNKPKRKINKKRVIIALIIFLLLILFIYRLLTLRITNIYISNNSFYTDQEIIDMSSLKDYPVSIKNLNFEIKNRLEDNKYILKANVRKNIFLNKVYIDVVENYPLFYYQPEDKTILYDGSKVSDKFNNVIVINQIPDKIYEEFLKKMDNVDIDILNRMSEIEYQPNEVDNKRFLILMNDGNYVYVTIKKFLTINKYVDIIMSFEGKKGTLYLDSGEYFDVDD